jgi:hypothetical protein
VAWVHPQRRRARARRAGHPVDLGLGQVDVPEEVVEAHLAGELVLFPEAGASVGAPSPLPTCEVGGSDRCGVIGYSPEDLIMNYLGRGLRADSRHWILTDKPDTDLYKRLKISPIPFELGAFADLSVDSLNGRLTQRWAFWITVQDSPSCFDTSRQS